MFRSFRKLQARVSHGVLLVELGIPDEMTQKLAKTCHLEDSVLHFDKIANHNKVAHFYNAADLFVFPSTYEGFGLPPLEAMASGCPVIAGNRAAIPEVVADAGILIDPLDTELLAMRMEEILENKSLREDLIERGLQRASMFSWKKCGEETVRLYRRVSKRYNTKEQASYSSQPNDNT